MTQPAILRPVPDATRFLVFGLAPDADARAVLARLAELPHDDRSVIGVGSPLALTAPKRVEGLRAFPGLAGSGVSIPSTQGALYAAFEGDDAGDCLLRARAFASELARSLTLLEDVAGFKYAGGRDLTGYQDGTENPKGDRAAETAIVRGHGKGLDGASFVSTQRWVHDLAGFERLGLAAQDAVIGRSRATNEELEDAPATAHVKRSAQESFDPPSFLLRRSVPCGGAVDHGLFFVAFAASLDPFERILRRMAGLDDGLVDGLFRFSHPVSGAHWFCPPVAAGRLDLTALGL